MHRPHAVKWAIQTWKNYLVAHIAGTPNSFSLKLCHLTKQCNYMLNMLQPNQQNPNLSA